MKKLLVLFIQSIFIINILAQQTGTVKDVDGNVYKTIQIGSQVWMAENLKTTHYQNGIPIINILDNETWRMATKGAYCWFNNDVNNKNTYGGLYNWYAVIDANNLCPSDWHVPTDLEWATLINYLGEKKLIGEKFKSEQPWNSSLELTNNCSLFLQYGGLRSDRFEDIGFNNFCYWWSSSAYNNGTDAWGISVYKGIRNGDGKDIRNGIGYKYFGESVRCIRDSLVITTKSNLNACLLYDWQNNEYINVNWSGECRDGYAYGKGDANWNEGTASGEVINGKLVGNGKWEGFNNAANSKIKYEGNFESGEPNGQGVRTRLDNGSQYGGEFVNGYPEGKGIAYIPDKNIYIVCSTYKDGVPDGDGYIKQDGQIVNVVFKNGETTYSIRSNEPESTLSNKYLGYTIGALLIAGGVKAVMNHISSKHYSSSYNSLNYSSSSNNGSSEKCYTTKFEEGYTDVWGKKYDDYYIVKCLKNYRELKIYIDKNSTEKPYYIKYGTIVYSDSYETFDEALKAAVEGESSKLECGCDQ